MNKTIKRTLAIVMAVAMLFALSATAFADNDITVYVTIQKANVPTGNPWNYTLGDLSVTKTYATNVAVQVPAGSTVKAVVEAMAAQNLGVTIVNSCSCGDCGTHTDYGCTCSSTSCTCTWKQVANVYWNGSAFVPDGTYSSAMNSLQYTYYDPDLEDDDTVVLTNDANYSQEGNYTRYAGNSWEYFTAATSSGANVYSNTEYMSQFVVSDGLYITLSYDYSTFVY